MGITVNQSFMTPAGFEIPSHYISLGNTHIVMVRPPPMPRPIDQPPEEQKYAIEVYFNIWVSKTARDQGRASVGMRRVHIVRDTPITDNVYTVLYEKLKEELADVEYTEDI